VGIITGVFHRYFGDKLADTAKEKLGAKKDKDKEKGIKNGQ
jgi:hypothetical protein